MQLLDLSSDQNSGESFMKQENLFENPPGDSWFQGAIDFLKVSEGAGWPDQFGEAFQLWSQKNKRIRTLSLFSGGGGLDIGFHDMGFDIVECVEIEKNFAATLNENSKEGRKLYGSQIICKDIREYTPALRDIDFIIGGPPCQTFSAAGARASGVNGIDDERGVLFEEYVRILRQLNPVGFLFENVYRIVGAQNGKPWKLIQEAFSNAGYKLHWRILDAADYGVPQHRERLIIIGLRDNGSYHFPWPSHGPDSADGREHYNAGQAVQGVKAIDMPKGLSGRHGHLLEEIPPGLNYSYYTDRMGHPKPIFAWRSKFSDYLYKADPDLPVRTIKAQGGQYTGPLSWENRHFSAEEVKRLQTFPDDYVVVGGRQAAVHQLGNSVPPQLARILALSVLDQVFKVKIPFKIDYLSEIDQLGFRSRKSELTDRYKRKAENQIKETKVSSRKPAKKLGNKNIEEVFYLGRDLRLSTDYLEGSIKFSYQTSFLNKIWKIRVFELQNEVLKYSIEINLSPLQQKLLGIKEIYLESTSDSLVSVLAAWKYLEKLISEFAHKDDLIQLFGYYQYRQSSEFKMNLIDSNLALDTTWLLLSGITHGLSVGQTVPIEVLSQVLGISSKNLKVSLAKLKKIGYEIRNSNTNSQIDPDHYLIPYSFPTLNERSLQRLTAL